MNTGDAYLILRLSFRLFIDIVIILVPTFIAREALAQSFTVCQGEFEAICNQHDFHIDRFEHCGDDNGVSGANPLATAILLCGPEGGPRAGITQVARSISGNHCGYSWFRITCRN